MAPLVQDRAAGEVERQAQAERDAGLAPRARPGAPSRAVSRLMRPSSSSSPQSPHVEPSGRCFHRFVTSHLLVRRSVRAGGSRPASRRSRCTVPTGWSSFATQGSRCRRSTFPPDEQTSRPDAGGRIDDAEGLRRLGRRAPPRADRPVQGAPPRAPPRHGGVGGGDRDRALRRGRRHGLPQAAHARLRGLDGLALPPDERPHARGRSRDHPRGHGRRRRRRPGAAPEPVAVRPVHRPPRDVDRARPRLQRLRHRAVHAVLRPPGPDRAHPAHRHRRRRHRDRAGRRRRVQGGAAARHRAAAVLPPRATTRCGPPSRPPG